MDDVTGMVIMVIIGLAIYAYCRSQMTPYQIEQERRCKREEAAVAHIDAQLDIYTRDKGRNDPEVAERRRSLEAERAAITCNWQVRL